MDSETSKEVQVKDRKLETEVQGRKVTLYFSDTPNLEIASRIKMALLGTVMPETDSM